MLIKKAIDEKYLVDSLQVLIFIIIPFSAFILFLSDPKTFWYVFPAYFISVIGWFLSTDYFIIGKGNKINDLEYLRNDEQRKAAFTIKILFTLMMSLSLFLFYLYFGIIVIHPNNTLS